MKRTGKSAAGSPAAASRGKPKIPPPREPHLEDRGQAEREELAGSRRNAVAIFDTSVPLYMQTVRETSICPELSPLRSLIAAADVAAADLAAYAFRSGAGDPIGPPPGLDPAFLAGPQGKSPSGSPDGKAPDGKAPDGKAPDGKAPNGKASNGKDPDGKAPHAQALNGDAPNGEAVDGESRNDTAPNDTAPNDGPPEPAGEEE
ncbi:hypothetical protein AB0M47_38465 [Hamadaea sp. NPDC051192]|uniref:hypothetical protein n=1 Tax=Hamadaea sp. NPDC051192 TaxID=3154940 RepID=UPI003442D939